MTYGIVLRISGEFFNADSISADPQSFLRDFRQLIRDIQPVPASRHVKDRPFLLKDLGTCSQVFKRVDIIRKPLGPYMGPHEVVKRISDKTYIIKINGTDRTVSADALKPPYLEAAEPTSFSPSSLPPESSSSPTSPSDRVLHPPRTPHHPFPNLYPSRILQHPLLSLPRPIKRVSFPPNITEETAGRGERLWSLIHTRTRRQLLVRAAESRTCCHALFSKLGSELLYFFFSWTSRLQQQHVPTLFRFVTAQLQHESAPRTL